METRIDTSKLRAPGIPSRALRNSPVPHDDVWSLPMGWAFLLDSQIFSRSHSTTILYDTPVYNGIICWSFNEFWGDLAGSFEWKGNRLQSCDGDDIGKKLGIPEDYYVRSGADGWQKVLTREMFEMWLREPSNDR